eukprot:g1816.t1
MHTLFLSITGGIDWYDAYEPLRDVSALAIALMSLGAFGGMKSEGEPNNGIPFPNNFSFAREGQHGAWRNPRNLYIVIGFFTILNVVTGTFVNTAIESAAADKDGDVEANGEDLAAQKQSQRRKSQMSSLRHIFSDITIDMDEQVTIENLQEAMTKNNNQLSSFLQSMGISTDDLWTLFLLIDEDDNGVVDIDEFVSGCMQLRGPAQSLQVAKMGEQAHPRGHQADREGRGTSSFTDLDPPALPGHQLLPPSVRVLDVPTAMDFFDHHDKVRAYGNTGLLDKKAFAEMLFAIAQGKDSSDFQGLGVLDQEQFLGWTFCTPNNYHSNIRLRFQQVVKEHQLRELLEALVIGNGLRTLNQLSVGKEEHSCVAWTVDALGCELWFLVDTCRVPLSRFSADELHSYLANGAEGVDPSEFLNWLFPGRELRELRQKVDHLRQQQPEESEEESPTEEHGLQRPIIVEFRVAHAFMPKINYIEENLGGFSELRLEVNVVIDESLRNSCGHVVIKTGRDMIIWDTGTMTPYREDPFVTKAGRSLHPEKNMAAQVGHLKKQKRRLKRAAARAAAARRASRASRHSSHRASSHASGDEHPGHHEHLQQ